LHTEYRKAIMDFNSCPDEENKNESEKIQLMEKDEGSDDIIHIFKEEANLDGNERLPAEPQQEQNSDNGPNLAKKPKPSPAYKRVELCVMDKVRVIAAGNAGLSQRQVAKQFGISKTQVQTLLKRKDEIMRCYNEGHQGWRKRTKFRRHSFEDINRLVSVWYTKQGDKDKITGTVLKQKAMEFSVELGLGEEFKASNGWLDSFKRRYDIRTVSRKNSHKLINESATMVATGLNQGCATEEMANNVEKGRNKETNNEQGISAENNDNQEVLQERMNPKIHNVFSMQTPQPVIHSVHPVLLPSSQVLQQQSGINSQNIRATHPYPRLDNNLQALAEIVGHEATIQIQIKSYSEALHFANALKAFAVEMGSVTLIGLMTAMQHELQRESRNFSPESDKIRDTQIPKDMT